MFQFNDWWLPDGETHLIEYMSQQPQYQSAQRRTSLGYVKRFGVAIDVGAHIGLWSRELAQRFDCVHAFEPMVAHAECFERNVTSPNVKLYRVALGRESGFVSAEVATPGNSGTTYVYEVNTGVPMRPLDSFGFAEVDFLKIDVEGFELFVCEGARETLTRCRPVVVLEQKSQGQEYFGVAQFAARDFLRNLGASVLGRVRDDWILGWIE